MARIGSLTVDLTLKSAQFINDLSKSSREVARNTALMQRSVGTLTAGFGALFSAKLLRKIADVTTESLKLAASMHGPLADAATKSLTQFEELQHTLQLGLASGFLDQTNKGLVSTAENLRLAGEAGKTFGNILGKIAKAGGTFFGKELPAFIKEVTGLWNSLNDTVAAFNIGMDKFSDHAKTVQGLIKPEDTEIVLAYGTALELAAMEQESFWGATVTTTAAGEMLLRQSEAQMKIWENTSPLFAYELALRRIEAANLDGQTAAIAQSQAAAVLVNNYLELVDNVGQALGAVFKDSKAVAIAQTVINTAQAVMKTFAEYGATPWGFALAASVAAIGAAQIAAILSAEPGSGKSAAIKSKGSSSAPARAGSASRGGSNLQQSVNITIEGESFGPEHFKKLLAGLNGVLADGAVLRMN